MIDHVLNLGPVQQESYYFQLIPISLAMVNPSSELPAAGTTYRFTVSKGMIGLIQRIRDSMRIRYPLRLISNW